MLTLTRRTGEKIVIGDDVVVEVVQIQGGRVRLGVKAPRSLPVYRGELVEKIEGENLRARAKRAERALALPPNTPVIHFQRGLFGMPDLKSWVLCELDESAVDLPGQAFVRVLVSVEDPSIRLLVVDLCTLDPSYPSDVALAAAGCLGRDAAIAGVVTVPTNGDPITVNTVAPLVIDMMSREGQQVIITLDGLDVRTAVSARGPAAQVAP